MSRYFAAFDGAVAAAGYNAYHELIALGVPSLFVPMPRHTDDQPARARYADRCGIGLGVDGPADPRLEEQLDRLLDPSERAAIATALTARPPATGARDAAAWLAAGAPPHPADGLKTLEGATESTRRRGAKEFRRRWGSFFAQLAADRLSAHQAAGLQAAGAGVGVRGRDRPGRGRRGGAGGRVRGGGAARADPGRHRRARGARRAARARGRGRARPGGVESRRRSSAGVAYEDFVRRTAGADPR